MSSSQPTSSTITAAKDQTVWEPAEILQPSTHSNGYVLIILNQPIDNTAVLKALWNKASSRIAADGGANRLLDAAEKDDDIARLFNEQTLDIIAGDLDSVTASTLEAFKAHGTVLFKDEDQYSTDFTKAFKYARLHFPGCDVVVLGGLGGRVDQGVATLNHLFCLQGSDDSAGRASDGDGDGDDGGGGACAAAGDVVKLWLVSTEGITFALKAGKKHRVKVKDEGGVLGRNIGIIPAVPCKVSTKGLEWDVESWLTMWGGQISTSNYVREEWVELEADGDLLFTIDYKLSMR